MLSRQSAKIEFDLIRKMRTRRDTLTDEEAAILHGAELALAWILEWEGKRRDVKPSRFVMESAMARVRKAK